MTKKTVEQVLAESRALRLSFKPPVAKPEPINSLVKARPWRYGYFQVLANPEVTFEDILINVYATNGPVGVSDPPVGTTVLVHNHEKGKGCFANTNCYILGYKESEGDSNAD